PELAAYLEGVGPAKADAIVRYRQQHGPFQDRMDLTKVPGIGPKIVDNNSDMISFGAGPMASGGLANREDAGSVD
ncbi:MAG: helix-hairpin-helix domain-containing protein, partial [Candidatus Competibacteraceae bacterium]|nr:helix-hairpin-helix domain-containing protein [Candidatus Competibacteraceae bacterium]